MKDSIMARSKRGGVTVGLTSSAPPEGSIVIGSTKFSSAAGIAPEAGGGVEASPHDLFEVPMLGSALFI